MPAGVFHVTVRSIDRRRLFLDSNDNEACLRYVERAAERYGWRVLAYCLMPNHIHLLVETPDETLAAGMQHINQSYAQRFNRRRDRTGHVFEHRYWSKPVSPSHYMAAACYVVLNPVRAHLVDSPAEWRWSSFAVVAGRAPAPAFLDLDRTFELLGCDKAAFEALVLSLVDMARALGAGHVPKAS
jgi:REP element-mobilizing transposase RayT